MYRRPIAVFYPDEKPIDFQPLHDFRKISGTIGFQQPVQLNFEIQQAICRRQVALNLIDDLYGEPWISFTARNSSPSPLNTVTELVTVSRTPKR